MTVNLKQFVFAAAVLFYLFTPQSSFSSEDPSDQVHVSDQEVQIILSRVIPDLDRYTPLLADQLDTLVATKRDGRMIVDIKLVTPMLKIFLPGGGARKILQPYAVRLRKDVHFEIYMRKDVTWIDNIHGLSVLVSLPGLSDTVFLKKVVFDLSSERVSVLANAFGGLGDLVVLADVKARKFIGIDWLDSFSKNKPF